MIDEIQEDARERMVKTIDAFKSTLARIRTGRANPALLDGLSIEYYGTPTPISQIAGVTVEEGRTLLIQPWEKNLIPEVEKAILKSDLGLTPSSSADNIRLPMPPLTEENRKNLTKQARAEAESSRVAIRNIRREANADIRELVKEKEATEDDGRRAEDQIQKITDALISDVDSILAQKETDLMEI